MGLVAFQKGEGPMWWIRVSRKEKAGEQPTEEARLDFY